MSFFLHIKTTEFSGGSAHATGHISSLLVEKINVIIKLKLQQLNFKTLLIAQFTHRRIK